MNCETIKILYFLYVFVINIPFFVFMNKLSDSINTVGQLDSSYI